MLYFSLQKVRKMLIVLETTLDKSIVLLGRKMTCEKYFSFSLFQFKTCLKAPYFYRAKTFWIYFFGGQNMIHVDIKKCYTTLLPRDALKLGSGQFQF